MFGYESGMGPSALEKKMELTKIRNWSDDELKVQETQASEQLFRIRFQAKLGQNEGVKKLRELRKDIARIKTVMRQKKAPQIKGQG